MLPLLLGAAVALAGTPPAIVLQDTGSFYVRGQVVPFGDQQPLLTGNASDARSPGEIETKQIYVHFDKLARPRSRFPILLWHGGSVSGVTFESTPDGRPGWQALFLRAGYSVYIVDAFQGGRAPWSPFPQVNREGPRFRSKAFVWETFRVGPPGSYARSEAFEGTRFPTTAFDQLAMQVVPRFSNTLDENATSISAVLDRIGPCVLLAHSGSAPAAFEAARRRPELVKALIAVEPSGGIDTGNGSIAILARIPQLIIWGDNVSNGVSGEGWVQLYMSSRRYADELRNAEGDVNWIDLPEEGIRGNSHMLMMDNNSDEIGSRIVRWLRKHSL